MTIHEPYRIGPRSLLQPGQLFRVAAGPVFHGHRLGLRGTFEYIGRRIERGRIYLDCWLIQRRQRCGQYLVFVAGDAYRMRDLPAIVMKPYRVKRCKLKQK